MARAAVAPTNDATDSELSKSEWVAQGRYLALTAEEAAADPRTPDRYLYESGIRSLAQYQALCQRRHLSPDLRRALVKAASAWPGTRSEMDAGAAAALTHLPGLTRNDLLDIAQRLPVMADGSQAVLALAQHPAVTDDALIWAFHCTGIPPQSAVGYAVASTGSLVPYAWRVYNRQGNAANLPYGRVDSVATLINALVELFPNPQVRAVAAVAGLTFAGTAAQLANTLTLAVA